MYFSSLWLKKEKEGNADPESRPGPASQALSGACFRF